MKLIPCHSGLVHAGKALRFRVVLDLLSTKHCFGCQVLVVLIQDFYALDTDEKLKA